MDEQTYKAWWPLHLRVAKGENLTDDERAFYETELKQLHDAEQIELAAALLRNTRKSKSHAAVRAEVKKVVARNAVKEN
jgi:hypothetical protein